MVTAAGAAEVWLDERGRRCPAPVLALGRAAASAPPGTVIAVLTTDPAADSDIPAWCRMRGAEHLGTVPPPDGGQGVAHVVRLAVPAPPDPAG